MAGAVASASRAADVILPPTLVLDFLYLGIPLGLFAGIALLAGLTLTYRHMRRRGRGRAFSAAMGALVFCGGNLAIYLFWLNFLRVSPSERYHRDLPPAPAPSTTSTSVNGAP
jgi:hypothetical protein